MFDQPTLGEAAIVYARQGFRVLPLPPLREGPPPIGWNSGPPMTVDEVAAHWLANPTDNVGLAMGDGTFAIVVEGAEGCENMDTLQAQLGGMRPPTMMIESPNGFQLLYFVSDWCGCCACSKLIENNFSIAPGIEVRSDGGFVVAAPSRTSNYRGRHAN